MNPTVACVTCKQLFDTAPEKCPACAEVTFVHLTGNEDPIAVCEELLFVAALVRLGFDQSQLSRSGFSDLPVAPKQKVVRMGLGYGRQAKAYRFVSVN